MTSPVRTPPFVAQRGNTPSPIEGLDKENCPSSTQARATVFDKSSEKNSADLKTALARIQELADMLAQANANTLSLSAQVEQLQMTVTEKDSAIAEQDSELQEKSSLITRQEAMIKSSMEMNDQLQNLSDRKDNMIERQETVIAGLEKVVVQQKAQLDARDATKVDSEPEDLAPLYR